MGMDTVNQPVNASIPVQNSAQGHPVKNSKVNLPIIFSVLVLLLIVGGGAYYLGTQKTNTSQNSQLSNITTTHTTETTYPPIMSKIQRIVLKEGYYFDVTIPEGYSLRAGVGDYVNYIVDNEGEELIGFQKSSGGGELSRTNPITIDGVPLVIMYRNDIGCPANIFSEKASNPQKMYFGIMTWCKDEKDTQLPVYKQVIESIVFGSELKEVLLGNKLAPATDNVNDWTVYVNTSQKYSVKYPSDWIVEDLEGGIRMHFRKVYSELGPHTDHSIYVTLQENKNGLSLKDWVIQNVIDPAASEYKTKNIDNNITRETVTMGDKAMEVVTGAHLPAAFDSPHVYFIDNKKVVEMALWPYSGGQSETDFDKKGKEILYNMALSFESTN